MEYKIGIARSSSLDSSSASDGGESPTSRTYFRTNSSDNYFIDEPMSSTTFHAVHDRHVSPRPSRLSKHLSVETKFTTPQLEPMELEDSRHSRYAPGKKSKKPKRRLFRNSRLLWYRVERCRPHKGRVFITGLGMLLAGILLLTTIALVTISAVIQLTYTTEECEKFLAKNDQPNRNLALENGTRGSQVEAWHSWKRSLSSREERIMRLRGWNISTWPDSMRINHFRVLGTHNSYHLSTSLPVNPLMYSHAPLYDQLGTYSKGVRQIELDVHLIDATYVVYHLQIIDDHTTCYCLLECLEHVRKWSDHNPYHFPISIFFEVKAKLWEDVGTGFSGVTDQHLSVLNKHIREAFAMDRLITPSTVLGNYNSYEKALMSRDAGWPPLSSVLGKVMFVWLDDVYDLASTVESVIEDPSLRKHLFFVGSKDTTLPYVTVAVINDPRDKEYSENMQKARDNNLLIRSLADNPNNMRPDPERFQMILKESPTYVTSDFECTESFKPKTNGEEESRSTEKTKNNEGEGDYCEFLPSKRPFECNPKVASSECFAIDFSVKQGKGKGQGQGQGQP